MTTHSSLSKNTRFFSVAFVSCLSISTVFVSGCTYPHLQPSKQHLGQTTQRQLHAAQDPEAAAIPAPVTQFSLPPKPQPQAPTQTFSIVVAGVDAAELLFALGRDATLNVDVHPGITGSVTLNAINQTLPQLLRRIASQVDMRYELEGNHLSVLPDTPYLKNYRVDYLNMVRNTTTQVSIATQVSTTGGGINAGASGTSAATNNNSITGLSSSTNNRFWDTLIANVRDLLRETDKILPEGSAETTIEQNNTQSSTGGGTASARSTRSHANNDSRAAQEGNSANTASTMVRRTTFREAAAVIANPESGVLAVRATARQHEKIHEFLDQVMTSAKRQVLIEATVVEVQLSDQYQQGINWASLRTDGTGWTLAQQPLGAALASGPAAGSGPGGTIFPQAGGVVNTGTNNPSLFVLRYLNTSGGRSLAAAVSLLESYGKVKVLSSPKLSVLNNQTALLKVVDNKVYFTVQAQVTPGNTNSNAIVTYNTTVHTVPIGFVMSVTPQIEPAGMVSVNVRPTISRIVSYVNDPNPNLTDVTSRIPEVQTRELESILRIQTGNIAVMGGLMQDTMNNQDDAVPGLSSLPLIGHLFKYRNQASSKSELVIFLRPLVLQEASLDGDLQDFKNLQPKEDFFSREDHLRQAAPAVDVSVREAP